NTGWVYTPGLASYAMDKMRSDFVTNGPDKTLGKLVPARVQREIYIVGPIFPVQRQPPKGGLKPEDIATNEYVDMSIGVGASGPDARLWGPTRRGGVYPGGAGRL